MPSTRPSRLTACVSCTTEPSAVAPGKSYLELLQLLHRNRRRIRQATREAFVSESDGLGVDGDVEAAGNSAAHRTSWRREIVRFVRRSTAQAIGEDASLLPGRGGGAVRGMGRSARRIFDSFGAA